MVNGANLLCFLGLCRNHVNIPLTVRSPKFQFSLPSFQTQALCFGSGLPLRAKKNRILFRAVRPLCSHTDGEGEKIISSFSFSQSNVSISLLSPGDTDGVTQAADVMVASFPYDDTYSWARALQMPPESTKTFLRGCVPPYVEGSLGALVNAEPDGVSGVLLLEDLHKREAPANGQDSPHPPSQSQARLTILYPFPGITNFKALPAAAAA